VEADGTTVIREFSRLMVDQITTGRLRAEQQHHRRDR
jgi:hypothetical protein